MTSRLRGTILLLLGLAAGCHKAGRSVVQVQITADPAVGALATVTLTAKQGSATVRDATTFDWKTDAGSGGITVGLYLPADVSGNVQILAAGYSASMSLIARSDDGAGQVAVTPGKDTDLVHLVLKPFLPDQTDGGGSDVRDAGSGSGGSGSGGTGGSGTGGSGTGGRDGGAAGGSGGGGPPDGGTDVPIVVVPRSWQAATKAEGNIDEADVRPAVAVDVNGNAVVAWEHGSAIWFNRYNAATGLWGTEGPISTARGQGVEIALDGQGVATAIWDNALGDATTQGIWTSTATGTGWTTPFRISAGRAFDAHLAVAPDGSAIAAWTENNLVGGNNQYIVWVSHRPAGGAWVAASALKNASDTGDRTPTVALDGAGNGFVIWEQVPANPDPDRTNSVWVSRYTAGAFGTPEIIDGYLTGDSDSGHVALNAAGAGVASWRQIFSDRLEVWGRIYARGAWGAPALISSASLIDFYQVPHVAIDRDGNVVAVWSQAIANGTFNARTARYRVAQAVWDTPQPLEIDNMAGDLAGEDVSPEVAFDNAGAATVLWRKKTATGLFSLWSRRMDATGVLSAPVRVDSQNLHSAFAHGLAVAPNGIAIAVWYYGSEFDIWAGIYR